MADETEDAQVKPFTATLREINRGNLVDDLSHAMREVVAAVQETGKKGSITLRIDVELLKGSYEGAMAIRGTVKANAPKVIDSSIFFADEHSNPVRDSPSQPSLPLEGLEGGRSARDRAAGEN